MKQKIMSLLFATTLAIPALAAPKVVSSIYPLQQIANAIAGEPTELLADSYLSPHDYAITPANVRLLQNADLVVWVGEAMMPQLHRYIESRQAKHGSTITASRLPDIHLITGGEAHDHGAHEEEHHAHDHHKHSHDDNHKHHEYHEGQEKAHAGSALNYDPHLWLSTDNAKAIAKAIAQHLSRLNPQQQARYAENLQQFINEVSQTKAQIADSLTANPLPPYFVFHDAYQYFEQEFGVAHAGVIRAHSGQTPRTKHLVKLQKQLASTPNACLFREPQFQSPLVDKLGGIGGVKVATLDPVGYRSDKDDGQAGYPAILTAIAVQLQQCGKP